MKKYSLIFSTEFIKRLAIFCFSIYPAFFPLLFIATLSFVSFGESLEIKAIEDRKEKH